MNDQKKDETIPVGHGSKNAGKPMRASLPPGNNLASKLLALTSLHFLRLGSHFMPTVALPILKPRPSL